MSDPFLRCGQCHQRVTAEMDNEAHCELIVRLEDSRKELRTRLAAVERERDELKREADAMDRCAARWQDEYALAANENTLLRAVAAAARDLDECMSAYHRNRLRDAISALDATPEDPSHG